MSSWMEKTKDGLVIRVRVVPRAARDEIVGLMGGEALKIRIGMGLNSGIGGISMRSG